MSRSGPSGYFSDEDAFLSDYSDDYQPNYQPPDEPQIQTLEMKMKNVHYAIMQRNFQEFTSLLEDEDINVNLKINEDWPLILLAATVGHFEITRELILKGADVNVSRDKVTPLMAACSCPEHTSSVTECLNIVKLLLENGADAKALDQTRKTALMLASHSGYTCIVKELLPHSNINAEDIQGWNALFYAVQGNKSDVVSLLLEGGLTVDKIDVRGNDISYYASFQGDANLLQALSLEEESTNCVIEAVYNFDTMFEIVSSPSSLQFLHDIDSILQGVKCESLIDKFVNMNLLEFLSLNSEELIKLGIEIPYQRNRILTGLYKFHQQQFIYKSIPVVSKHSTYSTFDVSKALIAAIRHTIVMEAGIKYILKNFNEDNIDKKIFLNKILEMKKNMNKFKCASIRLNVVVQKWDSEHIPADLITNNAKKTTSRWFKLFSFIGLTSFVCLALNKLK